MGFLEFSTLFFSSSIFSVLGHFVDAGVQLLMLERNFCAVVYCHSRAKNCPRSDGFRRLNGGDAVTAALIGPEVMVSAV
jgi:hypothetical protein